MMLRSNTGYALIRRLWPLLTVLLAYDVAITAIYVVFGWRWVAISDLPLPLLGSAIVLMVTLRNNAAYARWWEARGLWGTVVNNSRSIARATLMQLEDPALRERLVRQQIAYVLALRARLLRLPPDGLAYLPPDLKDTLAAAPNVPFAIQASMARDLAAAVIDPVRLSTMDRLLSQLMDAQGGLERIKGTPLPAQYNQFPLIFTRIYCVLLPVGLLPDLGILTPLASTLIGFMFLALDRIGRDLEEPFEGTDHDVPMASITRTIEIDLLVLLGHPAPPPIVAEGGVLR